MRNRFLHQLLYSFDGNFHQMLRDKLSDPKDRSLLDGWSYVVNQPDFKMFLAGLGNTEKDVST